MHACAYACACVIVGQNQSNLGSSLWFSILGHLPLSLASGLGMSSSQATFITRNTIPKALFLQRNPCFLRSGMQISENPH